MRKTLAIVLVVAFVLGLGSVVWATQIDTLSIEVEGWGSFYSSGETDVTAITPIVYIASDNELWVAVEVSENEKSGEVLVYNLDSDADPETETLIGSETFDNASDVKYALVVVDLGDDDLKLEHSIIVTVEEVDNLPEPEE